MRQQSKLQYYKALGKNSYPDNTSKRLHLKTIESAIAYLTKKGKYND